MSIKTLSEVTFMAPKNPESCLSTFVGDVPNLSKSPKSLNISPNSYGKDSGSELTVLSSSDSSGIVTSP